jgi:uncharacterized protein YfeS
MFIYVLSYLNKYFALLSVHPTFRIVFTLSYYITSIDDTVL